MTLRTKRWNDPVSPDDGLRVLICRYRPRGVPKESEPWDAFVPALAPSKALHAEAYGKTGPALAFEDYTKRFRAEMADRGFWLRGFAERVLAGDSITLLCSSACVDEARCHRTLVREMIDDLVRESERPLAKRGRPR